jgi:hypothetical protein
MLTQTIWWGGILLEFLLLLRGIQTKWVRRFPIFYSYHIFILVQSLVLFPLPGLPAVRNGVLDLRVCVCAAGIFNPA